MSFKHPRGTLSALFVIAMLLAVPILLTPASAQSITTLSDGSDSITLTFSTPGTQTTYLKVPKNANPTWAQMDMGGSALNQIVWKNGEWSVKGINPHDCNGIKDGQTELKASYCSAKSKICSRKGSIEAPDKTNISWQFITPADKKIEIELRTNGCPGTSGELYIARTPSYRGIPVFSFSDDGKTTINSGEIDLGKLGYTPGDKFVLKIIGSGIGRVQISPDEATLPSSLLIDIGRDRDVDWKYQDQLETIETTSDFSDELNEYLVAHSAQKDGNVIIPIEVQSASIGKVTLSNINIQYDTLNLTATPTPTTIPVEEEAAPDNISSTVPIPESELPSNSTTVQENMSESTPTPSTTPTPNNDVSEPDDSAEEEINTTEPQNAETDQTETSSSNDTSIEVNETQVNETCEDEVDENSNSTTPAPELTPTPQNDSSGPEETNTTEAQNQTEADQTETSSSNESTPIEANETQVNETCDDGVVDENETDSATPAPELTPTPTPQNDSSEPEEGSEDGDSAPLPTPTPTPQPTTEESTADEESAGGEQQENHK